MTDSTKQADGGSPNDSSPDTGPLPAGPRRAPEEFVQLTLDPTIIGPGMRTEDPYEPGTKVKVEGQRGIFTYRYASISQAGLVSLHLTRDGVSRAVRPDEVTMVRKTRPHR